MLQIWSDSIIFRIISRSCPEVLILAQLEKSDPAAHLGCWGAVVLGAGAVRQTGGGLRVAAGLLLPVACRSGHPVECTAPSGGLWCELVACLYCPVVVAPSGGGGGWSGLCRVWKGCLGVWEVRLVGGQPEFSQQQQQQCPPPRAPPALLAVGILAVSEISILAVSEMSVSMPIGVVLEHTLICTYVDM